LILVFEVRERALETLGHLQPATLAQHADAVLAKLEDTYWNVRKEAVTTLSKLQPAALAQHADAVVAKLEHSNEYVRKTAVVMLGKLEPARLAQHAGAVLPRLDHRDWKTRVAVLELLAKLEPAALAQYGSALVARLEDSEKWACRAAMHALKTLPCFDTPAMDWDPVGLRSRLLGRLGWYRCRLRLRVVRSALYWYALQYRPSGPGHARDVDEWDRMVVEEFAF